MRKPDAQGIHGTLFYELEHKKEFYPSKRESDVAGPPHSFAVWLELYPSKRESDPEDGGGVPT